ncbi:MAG TPA: hypothetical protein VFS05_05190 [Gemmatimonadaceae bacterium]|nr:hypothetical protein [Gemmatimonadaceae bacterium]
MQPRTSRRMSGPLAAARRLIAAAVVLSALVSATACGGDDKSTGANRVEGTYTLRSASDQSLPATIFEGQMDIDGEIVDVTVSALGGSLTLRGDDTFTGTLSLKLDAGTAGTQNAALPVHGTYERSGSYFLFTSDDPEDPQFEAELIDGSLEVAVDLFETGEPIALVFKK